MSSETSGGGAVRPRLEFISAGDFLSTEPEEIPWVIPPLCTVGSSMMLYGRQKVGKSSVITQMFHSLIHGEPWLGFPVEKSGPVVYLQLDMPKSDTRTMLDRAHAAGYDLRHGLYVPKLPEREHKAHFNILDPSHARELRAACDDIRPVAVVVDTINDAYEPLERGDVNSFQRRIHSEFQAAIGDAVLVFLNHRRKQVQTWQKEEMDDTDGYLGGSSWAGVVTSNLELRRSRKDNKVYLELRDLRHAFPASRIPLKQNELGFFEPDLNAAMMLMFWPGCLPLAEQAKVVPHVKSKNDVFRDIAARTGTAFDTVKKTYQRADRVRFPWEAFFEDEVPESAASMRPRLEVVGA